MLLTYFHTFGWMWLTNELLLTPIKYAENLEGKVVS